MPDKIRKAVIPAAGLGTRFLPATKAQPKEMLPIVDTPTIQFVVEEAVKSGITDIIIITGKGKRAIEDHFDTSFELEQVLKDKKKDSLLKEMERISNLANIHFVRQKKMLGLGDAIRCAKYHIDGEPFAVLLGDSLIDSKNPPTKQLVDIYNKTGSSVIGVEKVPMEKVNRFGVIDPKPISDRLFLVKDLVEKPPINKAPSNLTIAARYVFTPEIFDCIDKTKKGVGGELQITDSLRILNKSQKIYAYLFDGKRYDIGNKLDYLKTIVDYGLKRNDFGEQFKSFLIEKVSELEK